MSDPSAPANGAPKKKKTAKCLVWDLDNTLWDGVLLEDENVSLRPGVLDVIKTLDSRGILHSIASKNNHDHAMEKIRELGLEEYFLYPQINWNSKATSIEKIAELINIGIDTLIFMDDQPYERDEVSHSLPMVETIDAADLDKILDMPRFNPQFITNDSKMRRKMYMAAIERDRVEDDYVGPKTEFLESLEMVLALFPADPEDLARAEELTVRTNQLNATGYTYSYAELDHFRTSPDHLLLMARLEDKYGTYGNIGLMLVDKGAEIWTLKLMLMSCRVMSRGVGGVMLSYLMNSAKEAGVRLQAEFLPTSRNRLMDITYRFANFREVERRGDLQILEHSLEDIAPYPTFLTLDIREQAAVA